MVASESKQIQGRRVRRARSPILELAIVLGTLGLIAIMYFTNKPGNLGTLMHEHLRGSIGFMLSLQFLLFVPLIFLLEYIIPARPEQRGLSPSVVFDALYMLVHLPVISAFAAFISSPASNLLSEHASFLVIDSTRTWPIWLAAVFGLMMTDLGVWFSHLVKHKVSWFWRFHMIHHSQPRMSLFTANRTHPVDALIDTFILLVPLFFLVPSVTERAGLVFAISLVGAWTVRFQHANIRTNLGPLRYILVTPQSHRIHHSTDPDHWNSNYANVFAWDRVFGTQHSDVTSYPPTGINDPYFPEPERMSVKEFASSFVGQMLFPLDNEAVRRASTGSPHRDTNSRLD